MPGEVSAMSTTAEKEITVLRGRFTGGVVVLDDAAVLPEGTAVTVTLLRRELPTEMGQEFAEWDRAGAEAWGLIAEWEREEGQVPETLA